MLRANSLKKALRQIIEQAEKGKRKAPVRGGNGFIVFLVSRALISHVLRSMTSSFQWWTSRTGTRRSRGCRPLPPSKEKTVRS